MHFNCDMPLHTERVPEAPWASQGFIDGDVGDSTDFTLHLDEGNRCNNCSEEISEYVDGWKHEHSDSIYCHDDSALDELEIGEIPEWLEANGFDSPEEYEKSRDRAEPQPTAPGNWVGFTIDPERQQTQVQISAGDPRGCFTFTLRRWTDPQTGENKLLLHLPHPGEGLAHMALTEHHEGTYIVE